MIEPEKIIEVKPWFTCTVPRDEMRAFMRKDNYHAVISFGLWFLLLAAVGFLAFRLYPSPWAIPAFFLYGVIYCGNNPRWHETSHGTCFRTPWLNDIFYFFCGAMEFRDFVDFRWSHARHHSYTYMSGIDPEIAVPTPANLFHMVLDFFYLRMGYFAVRNLILNSIGRPHSSLAAYIPDDQFPRLFWSARAVLLLHLAAILWAVLARSWLPVLFFTLPRFFGAPFLWMFIYLQHVGLDHDVWDHRLSTRSLRLNFFLSFLFMNMESHVEHHIFPLVPFHALPRFRERVKDELPPPYTSLLQGTAELIPVLLRQQRDPAAHIVRPLPSK